MVRDEPATIPQSPAWPLLERYPFATGLSTLLVLHALLVFGPLQGITGMKPVVEPLFIGVVQLVYVVPMSIILFATGCRRTLKVFALGALVTFVLNAAACGAFVYIMNQAKW
jgi:hypothetical protein